MEQKAKNWKIEEIEEILKKFEEIQFAFLCGKDGVLYSWQKNVEITMKMSTTFFGSAAKIFLALSKNNLDDAATVVSFGKLMVMKIQENFLVVIATSEANLQFVSEELAKAVQKATKERERRE